MPRMARSRRRAVTSRARALRFGETAAFLALVGAASLVPFVSCSNSGNNGGGGGQGTSDGSGAGQMGGGGQGGSPGTGGSGGDVCAAKPGAVLNGCKADGSDATDARGMGPQNITFGVGSLTYKPKCLLVDQSQTVTFTGDFVSHPLTSGEIRNATECPDHGPLTFGGTGPKTFTLTPGVYPYYCFNHGPGGMDGVVIVDAGAGGAGGGGTGGAAAGGGTP
jgi:plastocyanin